MLDRVVIYLAGGRQVRWGNCGTGNECKHLIFVPDSPTNHGSNWSPLIFRTVSQVWQWNMTGPGNAVAQEVLVRPDPFQRDLPGYVDLYWDAKCVNWGAAAVRAAWSTALTNRSRRVVILLGDVYWDWNSLRRLLESESFVTVATDDVDTFGLSFESNTLPIVQEALERGGRKSGTIQRELSSVLGDDGWGRLLCDDWTQDFDIDWEHTQFLAGLSKNNHFRNTPDQVRRRRALGMRPRKRGRS